MTNKIQGAGINFLNRKNLIINGEFLVNERLGPFDQNTLNFGDYHLDRWRHDRFGSAASDPFTITRENIPFDQTFIDGGRPKYFCRFDMPNGLPDANINQFIEDANLFAGKTLTLSFWVKSDVSNNPFTVFMIKNYGSGGSTNQVLSSSFTASPTWTKYIWTFDVESNSGKILGTNAKFQIRIDMPINVVCFMDLTRIQLEEGSSASTYEERSYEEEHALCRRYFYRPFGQFFSMRNSTTTFFNGCTPLHIQHPHMRTTPSVTIMDDNFVKNQFHTFINAQGGSIIKPASDLDIDVSRDRTKIFPSNSTAVPNVGDYIRFNVQFDAEL